MISQDILKRFGVDEATFVEALKWSPSAQGYVAGAISEVLLRRHLEARGYEVARIKEKPSGGYRVKSHEARGDFYVRERSGNEGAWLVVESKGLKSNSEFRGSRLDSPQKVFRFLKSRIFDESRTKGAIYKKGHSTYLTAKRKWKKKNRGKRFLPFGWNKALPGSETYALDDIWDSENELKKWVFSLDRDSFTEQAYRDVRGAIAILETHQPAIREGIETGLKQAAPLVRDFNIMSVDLFFRTGRHEFVFMNSEAIAHSPTSPEHLYQNYTIDVLVKDKKRRPVIQEPWYSQMEDCIAATKPTRRQLDDR